MPCEPPRLGRREARDLLANKTVAFVGDSVSRMMFCETAAWLFGVKGWSLRKPLGSVLRLVQTLQQLLAQRLRPPRRRAVGRLVDDAGEHPPVAAGVEQRRREELV